MFIVYFSAYILFPWIEIKISLPYEWNSSIETILVILNIVLFIYILPKLLGYIAYRVSYSLSKQEQT